MRNKFLVVLILSTLFMFNNFQSVNANTTSEIESIYNDLISKVEVRMNNAVSELTKIYDTNISNSENTLKSYMDQYERTEQDIARKSNAVASYDLSLAQQIANEGKITLSNIYKNITLIQSKLDNLKSQKDTELNRLKTQYQIQIDQYKTEKQKLLDANSSSSTEIINTNSYYTNNTNTCGVNSSLGADGNCKCNQGFIWGNNGCIKQKTYNELCFEKYGANTYGDENYCYCSTGYVWNSNNTNCIKEVVKTPTELCQDSYGVNSLSDGKANADGTYNCSCKTGYIWNTNQTSCIQEIKTEEVKAVDKKETYNLSDNLIQKIDVIFENIKKSKSNLPEEKRKAFYEKLNKQLDQIYIKQKKDLNKNIINYLKSLVQLELNNKEDNLGELFDDLFATKDKPSNDFKCGDNISVGKYTYTTKLMPDGKCWTTTNMKHLPTSGESYCYGRDENNCDTYGALYNWDGAKSACEILGNNWKLPSIDEWKNLVNNGATGWTGNKLFGLISKLPGYTKITGAYEIDTYGDWWSYTEEKNNNIYKMGLTKYNTYIDLETPNSKDIGISVVCIKN